MKAIPPALLLTTAVALGLYLGWLYLRRERRPKLIGLHLLLGAAGLQTTLMMLRATSGGDAFRAGTIGTITTCLLAGAMFSGLLAPLLGRGSRSTANVVVATHASVGLAGFLLFLVWMLRG